MLSFRLLLRPVRLLPRRRCLSAVASIQNPTAHPPTEERLKLNSQSVPTITLSNMETRWAHLSIDEKSAIADHLEEIMKRDWRLLSIEEKKAAHYVDPCSWR
ncbi:hypothetical protein DFH09DRAFT_200586 [Mycena vulgaris]|nr:hypothetical protein DFH09DRAFT_200586 [Mycena vulgaris]